MKIGFITIAVLATLVSACDTPAPENTGSLDAYLATLPRNAEPVVSRACLTAVTAHSGLDSAELYSANHKLVSSGAQITVLMHPPAASYVGTLPSWECVTDSAGAVVEVDGPTG